MCYRPLHIVSRKIDFHLHTDPICYDVPCGHCCECLKAKQNEWFVRSYFEYLHNKSLNGVTLYVTLTFAPKHLPMYGNIPCFDKRKVQLFLKRFRNLVGIEGIKYFICSEYGGKTHRPHHHGLLFIPDCPKDDASISTLKRAVYDSWQYGFVSFGKYGGVVSDVRACAYVSKYIHKDLNFDFNLPKEFHPFHLQSKGFGSYMIEAESIDVDKLSLGHVFVPSGDDSVFKQVFIPQYIQRKLMYDVVKVGDKIRYVINDVGSQVLYNRMCLNLDDFSRKFNDLFFNVNNILCDGSRLEMFNSYLNTDFESSSCVWRFLQENSTPREVAVYSLLYCNRVVKHVGFAFDLTSPLFRPLDNDSINEMVEEICWPSESTLRSPQADKRMFEWLQLNLYNREFQSVDTCLRIYNALLYVVGRVAQQKFDSDNSVMSELKFFEKL